MQYILHHELFMQRHTCTRIYFYCLTVGARRTFFRHLRHFGMRPPARLPLPQSLAPISPRNSPRNSRGRGSTRSPCTRAFEHTECLVKESGLNDGASTVISLHLAVNAKSRLTAAKPARPITIFIGELVNGAAAAAARRPG